MTESSTFLTFEIVVLNSFFFRSMEIEKEKQVVSLIIMRNGLKR